MDNHNDNQMEILTVKKPKKRKSKFTGMVHGLIGGVISALIVVILFTSNLIPNNQVTVDGGDPDPIVQNDGVPVSEMMTSDDQNTMSIDEVSKAIVGIANIQQQDVWSPNEEAGSGSGIIYKKENGKAYIVTNNHVVEGAEEVEVDLNNDERVKAKVLGTDVLTDLAVLEIDGSNIEVIAELGSSGDLQVGETVLTIGNPLGMDFSGSVTKGIVSGLDRSIEVDTNGDNQADWVTEVIQTDAAINPGNSGGALVNANGQVIGINSMKIAQQAVEGIGFAIPIDTALPIMEQLETSGEVARPFIGVTTVPVNQVPQQYQNKIILPEGNEGGMVVADVQAGSPADQAGLQQFDVITKINDHEINSTLDLRKYMYSETAIGDTVEMEIHRNGKQQIVKLELTERII